ncbi:MAG: peptide chain release factor N(5)-glutamine methyltransferase [Lachnospiraceae bacterium]|nr:peptide chain release factor N(5)-glutamine methyltransferase [Lachnospiraceae bacterium]
MTYEEAFRKGAALLKRAGVEEYALDARLLLEDCCGVSYQDLLVYGDRELNESGEGAYFQAIARREQRIPLQQIMGIQQFMGLPFFVSEDVLIPRQDTEILVEEALKVLKPGMEILDLCTGSGCILLSLLYYSEECVGLGTDLSGKALLAAMRNRDHIQGLCGASGKKAIRAGFRESDLFASVTGCFDVIVSNPPYIASRVIDTLEPEVRVYEPRLALDGGSDGLFFYREILPESREHLNEGGWIFLEIGHDQGEAVSNLMRAAGFDQVRVTRDLAGLDRVVSGKWTR